MALHHNARIPTDGLVVLYDAADPRCYPGSGITLYNLADSATYPSVSLQANYAEWGSISNGVVNIGGEGGATQNGTYLNGLGNLGQTIIEDFTSIGWLYRTNNTDGEIFDYRGVGRRLTFDIYDSGMGFFQREIIDNNLDGSYSTASTTVSVSNGLNQWNCFALVRSGSSWSFYKDGVLINTTTFNYSEPASRMNGGDYSIGIAWSDDDYPSRAMNGSIGPVMQYNRALSQAEILQVYNSHKGRFN